MHFAIHGGFLYTGEVHLLMNFLIAILFLLFINNKASSS